MSDQQPEPQQVPTRIAASVIFSLVLDTLKAGLYSGEDCKTAAESILLLEQLISQEKAAELKMAEQQPVEESNVKAIR